MKYLHEIVWYLSLPLTIVVAYYAVLWGLKKFHKSNGIEEQEENK